MDMMKVALYLHGRLPKNTSPKSNRGQDSRQVSIEGHSTKHLASTQSCQGRETGEKSRKLSHSKDAYGSMTTSMWSILCWIPEQKKDIR